MRTHSRHQTPWYLWPFIALWRLLAAIVELTGRFVAMVLGIIFIIVGVIVSLTVIGFLLFLKGLF